MIIPANRIFKGESEVIGDGMFNNDGILRDTTLTGLNLQDPILALLCLTNVWKNLVFLSPNTLPLFLAF